MTRGELEQIMSQLKDMRMEIAQQTKDIQERDEVNEEKLNKLIDNTRRETRNEKLSG